MIQFFPRMQRDARPLLAINLERGFMDAAVFEKDIRDPGVRIAQRERVPTPDEKPTGGILIRVIENTIKKYSALQKIVIGLTQGVCDISHVEWHVIPRHARGAIFPRDLRLYFKNVFEEHRTRASVTLAHPVEILGNLYRTNLAQILQSQIHLLTFRAILATIPVHTSNSFADVPMSFGGIPFEYVPLALCHKLALEKACSVENAMVLDRADDHTALFIMKEGGVRGYTSFEHSRRGGAIDSGLWKKSFSDALENLFHCGPIPNNVILFENDHNKEIRAHLASRSWLGDYSNARAPYIRAIDASNIFGGDSCGGFLQGARDARLASLVYYAIHHKPLF